MANEERGPLVLIQVPGLSAFVCYRCFMVIKGLVVWCVLRSSAA